MIFGSKLNEDDRALIARNLLGLRTEVGFSQEKMADVLGISKAGYKNYETGRRDLPMSVAIRLSIVFNVSLDGLLLNKSNWAFSYSFTGKPGDEDYLLGENPEFPMSMEAAYWKKRRLEWGLDR